MSAYTTLRLTREKVVSLIIQEMMTSLSTDQLERMADEILERRLYNVKIVSDEQDNDNEEV